MPLSPGTRLGHYDVTALIGEGGMGQVWQATDTQLGRQVALKILPDAFADDPDRLARFQREAQVLASLNHPGIAAIYGIEKSEETQALVLELVEGPTLADRIAKGPIPADEALPIAKQIAEALEAAHEAGVIHRDLKPANIKVKDDGTVKVLDFGLAKQMPAEALSEASTETLASMTRAGTLLGTLPYMAPEQLRGQPADPRTDIWALGVVLYEMVAGERPFKGGTSVELGSAILQGPPTSCPTRIPRNVAAVIQRCLSKDPQQRFERTGEVRAAIADVQAGSEPFGALWRYGLTRRRLLCGVSTAAVALAALVTLNVGGFLFLLPGSGLPTATTFLSFVWVDRDGGEGRVPLPPRLYSHPRFSPDGTKLAVRVQPSVEDDGERLLWVYDVATGAGVRLTNEAMTWAPVWTPDSKFIMFGWNVGRESYELYSVPADGSGAPEALIPYDVGPTSEYPTSITPDGSTLIFSRAFDNRLEVWEMALDGSAAARPVIEGAAARGNAEVSPDGEWLAYRWNRSGQNEVYVRPYPGPGSTLAVSIDGGRGPIGSADGSELYYRRDTDIMVVDVDTGGGIIEISPPRELLRGRYIAGPAGGNREYHVAPDGRFLMLTENAPTGGSQRQEAQPMLVKDGSMSLTHLVQTN